MTKRANTNAQGYERIVKVEGEAIRELGKPSDAYTEDYRNNPIVLEVIWITTAAGDIFTDELKTGQTLEQRVAYYQRRGWTDDDCYFFKAGPLTAA